MSQNLSLGFSDSIIAPAFLFSSFQTAYHGTLLSAITHPCISFPSHPSGPRALIQARKSAPKCLQHGLCWLNVPLATGACSCFEEHLVCRLLKVAMADFSLWNFLKYSVILDMAKVDSIQLELFFGHYFFLTVCLVFYFFPFTLYYFFIF